MFDFHEKRKIRNVLYSKLVLVLLVLVVGLLLYSVFGVFQKERETVVNKTERTKVLSELKERERLLDEEINRLSTERGVEGEIRSKFDVAREGERVVIIIDSIDEDVVMTIKKKPSIWERIKGIFR